MITSCPHCTSTLKLGEAQQEKLKKAIAALGPGKKLTIRCPSCGKPIIFDAPASSGQNPSAAVKPPAPPDLSWMKEGRLQDDEKLEDVPMALILYPENKQRDIVRDALESVGYQVLFAQDVTEAMERMRFVNFACVVLHSQFDGPVLENSEFHQYMRNLAMNRRRYLFYILIGTEFHTLYQLQALVYSANLVVNEKDILNLNLALRKAIPVYEELFGPYMEELTSAGKS